MTGPNNQMPVQTGYADVHGAKLYYEIAGKGEPMVLVHRGLLDRRMWDDQFYEFAKSYRVVRYDLRGSGKSAIVPGDYSYHTDLVGLLDVLKLDAVNLVGQALGGSICIDFALAHPARVASLVLASSSLNGYQEVSSAVAAYQRAMTQMTPAEAVTASLALWVDGPRRRSEDVPAPVRRRVGQMLTDAMAQPQPPAPQTLDPAASGRLTEIDTPTLVLFGELDVSDARIVADLLVSQIDAAVLVEMARAGHMLNMERPAHFNQLVLDFLGG